MKKEKIEQQPVNFIALIHLLKVEIKSFNVSDNNGKVRKEDVKKFNFNFSFQIRTSLQEGVTVFSPNLDFHFYDENNINLAGCSANISAQFHFKIQDLKKLVEEQEDKSLIMNTILVMNLIGIIYSTLRGIILVKAQDTILQMVTLPVLNPAQLIDDSSNNIISIQQ